MRVVPSWQYWASTARQQSAYGKSSQDLSAPTPAPDQASRLIVRIPFKGFGRTQFRFFSTFDESVTAFVDETVQNFLAKPQFKEYRRRPQFGLSIEGPVQIDDSGNSIRVVQSLDEWRLARASGLYYRGPARDVPEAVTPEESTYQSFITRIPFKGFGRSNYRFIQPQDETFTLPESDTTPIWLARPKFELFGKSQFRFQQPQDFDLPVDTGHQGFLARPQYLGFGRTQFRFQQPQDESFVVPIEDFVQSYFTRLQFKVLGRTQFRFGSTFDESFVIPDDGVPGFIARPRFLPFGFNRFIFTTGTDSQFISPEFEQNPWIFVRFMRTGYDARRAAWLLHNFSTLDINAPAPVIPGEVMVVIPDTPGATLVRVLIEHPTTTRVVVDSPNKVIVLKQDDPAGIPLKVII